MINKITLRRNLDLIKIYESGKLPELEALLKEMNDGNLEFNEARKHFHNYYWELEEKQKGLGITPNLLIRKDLNRNKIYDDPLFPKFNEYASKFLGAKKKFIDEPKDIREIISDEIGIEFYNKYLTRGLKQYSFKTTLDEATKYGVTEIIDFIKKYN